MKGCVNVMDQVNRPTVRYWGQKCGILDVRVSCDTVGINIHACLEMTNENCEFVNGVCRKKSDIFSNCKINCCQESLNWKACISV